MHTADAGLEVRRAGQSRDARGRRVVRTPVLGARGRAAAAAARLRAHDQRAVLRRTGRRQRCSSAVRTRPSGAGGHAEPAEDHVCRPAAATRVAEEACATRILSTLARRAYRRPVTDAEVQHAARFLQVGPRRRRLRPGHPARASPHPVGAGVPVSSRARPPRLRSGPARRWRSVPDQRPRPGVTAVVLPLEQHPGRRAARAWP